MTTTDIEQYFQKGNKQQYKEFMHACENNGGTITESGACLLKEGKAKVILRDWRDNSIDRPSHDLNNIFARNDYYFLCYAQNSSTQMSQNLNNIPSDELLKDRINSWKKSLKDELVFPDWLVDRTDWKMEISNYGSTTAARKKDCDPEKEMKMNRWANDVFFGDKPVEEAIMEAILHRDYE